MNPLILLLGLGLGVGLLIRKSIVTTPTKRKLEQTFTPNNPSDWTGWVWPVPYYQGREPVISQGFREGERHSEDGTLNKGAHMGVDIMFRRVATDPTTPPNEVSNIPGGKNLGYIAPAGTPVVAAGPGMIWRAGDSARGKWIQIDHGQVGKAGGINTYYQHLETFAKPWKKGDQVAAGELLGLMGGDPSTSRKLRHLHFELWKPVAGTNGDTWPKDPAPIMRHWQKLANIA